MPTNILVQDNFLDKKYFEHLQGQILNSSFPWTVSTVHEKLSTTDYQFCHGVCHTENGNHIIVSTFYNELKHLFEKMGVFFCVGAKLNLLKQQDKPLEHPLHIDWLDAPNNLLTSILYFNTCNGYTKFESGEKINSVANRLVTFPNYLKHSGAVNTCHEPHRIVLNIGWIKKNA